MLWRCNPHAELRSIARAGGIVPDSAAGKSSDASICFTPRRACRSHGCGRTGLHPHGESVGTLVIDLAMATSTGAPTLLTAIVSLVGHDPALRWPAHGERRFAATAVALRPEPLIGPLSSFHVFSRWAHPSASSIEAGLTEGRSRFAGSRSGPCNARPRLSSPGAARHSSRCKKVAAGRPPFHFGPPGAGRSPPVSRPPSRTR
ncbi:hypothetical protein ACVWY5_000148 [Bradyrhizobium sp. USDA 3256]